MAMAEKSPTKKKFSIPGAGKIKKVAAPGSGGKITKGKGLKKAADCATPEPIRKDAMDVALGIGKRTPMKPASLPGMTAHPDSVGQDTRDSLAWVKEQGQKVAAGGDVKSPADVFSQSSPNKNVPTQDTQYPKFIRKPGADVFSQSSPNKNVPTQDTQYPKFIRKPGADEHLAAAKAKENIPQADITSEEKRAAGIGFLSNLISKFKGIGNKNWADLRGAGGASAGKAVNRMGARMALSETSPHAVQSEMNSGKFKSLAGGAPNQAPKGGTPLSGFKSLVHKAELAIAAKKGIIKKDEKAPGAPAAPKAPSVAPAPAAAAKTPKLQQTGPTGAPAGTGQANAAPPSAKPPKA